MFTKIIHTPTIEIKPRELKKHNIRLFIKRDDLTDPIISGNKYRKLKYNLISAQKQGYKTLLTFGGAYSNHIHAAASAGSRFGLRTIGVIRGERPKKLNPTLADAESFGMEFNFVSRTAYREKKDPGFIEDLHKKYGDFYLVPEGGSNPLAVKGCIEIVDDFDDTYDYVTLACGTGGTLAGIIAGLNGKSRVLGFPILKGGSFLYDDISNLIRQFNGKKYDNWSLFTQYHFGGYAKYNWDLIKFINYIHIKHKLQLDPVYTGKMLFGVCDLVHHGYFPENSKILAIHTGGLQGIRGFNQRFGSLIKI